MKVFIVYCHPSKDSFTYDVYKSFERGLRDNSNCKPHEILLERAGFRLKTKYPEAVASGLLRHILKSCYSKRYI